MLLCEAKTCGSVCMQQNVTQCLSPDSSNNHSPYSRFNRTATTSATGPRMHTLIEARSMHRFTCMHACMHAYLCGATNFPWDTTMHHTFSNNAGGQVPQRDTHSRKMDHLQSPLSKQLIPRPPEGSKKVDPLIWDPS